MFKRSNSAISPQALGVGANSAQVAQCVPFLAGRSQTFPKIIYRGNEKTGDSSGKKGKSGKKSGGITTYTADLDFLLATCGFGRVRENQLTVQPLQSVMSIWSDKANYAVTFASATAVVSGGSATITVPGVLVQIIGATVPVAYSVTFNDLGSGGSRSYTGSIDRPLWNDQFFYYDNSSQVPLAGSTRTPYRYTAAPSVTQSTTIAVDPALNGKTVTFYFGYVATAADLPLTKVNQVFEDLLGSTHTVAQPISYSDVGGVAAAQCDLGMIGGTPNFRYGTLGWGGFSPTADVNPADFLQLVMMGPHGLNGSALLQQLQGPTTLLGDLSAMRAYCDANGIWISPYMDQQRSGSDIITDILDVANCACVWSQGVLQVVPLSEMSQVGANGIYTAPTQPSDVVATITQQDYVVTDGENPVKIVRAKNKDMKNMLPLQFKNRDLEYADDLVTATDGASVSENGAQLASTRTLDWIKYPSIATTVATPLVKRMARNEGATISFKLSRRHIFLQPLNLIMLNDAYSNLVSFPARLTKADIGADYSIDCEAEPYYYTANSPYVRALQTGTPGTIYTNVDPGSVTTQYIFEPILRLSDANVPELWIAAAGSNQYYGGCEVLISFDAGASYQSLGKTARSTMGVTAGSTWPSHADPDTTNDLAVDLTSSLGVLSNWPSSAADSFVPLCVVDGGSGVIPYELIAYTTAQLTAANKYTLKATGAGNEIRRAVFSCPTLGAGVSHVTGKKFVYLNDPVLKVPLDPKWIGKTLYFKLLAYNIYGQSEQLASAVTAITYTPTGVAAAVGGTTYAITPVNPLSQASSSFVVSMAQCTATFSPSGTTTNYNARSFTVSDPGAGITQQYWVTIQDPGQVGDTGSGTTLSAFCDSNQTRWNTAGYIRIGSIVVTHTGGTTGGHGGSTTSSVLYSLVVTDSGDHQHFSLSASVTVLMLFVDGQKVNSADITLTGSSFALSYAVDPTAHLEAVGS